MEVSRTCWTRQLLPQIKSFIFGHHDSAALSQAIGLEKLKVQSAQRESTVERHLSLAKVQPTRNIVISRLSAMQKKSITDSWLFATVSSTPDPRPRTSRLFRCVEIHVGPVADRQIRTAISASARGSARNRRQRRRQERKSKVPSRTRQPRGSRRRPKSCPAAPSSRIRSLDSSDLPSQLQNHHADTRYILPLRGGPFLAPSMTCTSFAAAARCTWHV